MQNCTELEDIFDKHGIDYSQPGFYDSPAFTRHEKIDSNFLNLYADYVQAKKYSEEYIVKARKTILNGTDYLFCRLAKEGRNGECANASMVLSRILDKEGIWNYTVKGSLKIIVKTNLGEQEVAAFHPFRLGEGSVNFGHIWVFAPPFKLIDLTILLQNYPKQLEEVLSKKLQNYVIEESTKTVQLVVSDLMEQRFVDYFLSKCNRLPTEVDLNKMLPGLIERLSNYGIFEICKEAIILRYSACAITASDLPLNQMRNLCLNGEYPDEIYKSFLKIK